MAFTSRNPKCAPCSSRCIQKIIFPNAGRAFREKAVDLIKNRAKDIETITAPDGTRVNFTVDAFPARTFQGSIMIVSPKAELLRDATVFYARVAVPNADGAIRTGMEGRGKIRVGWQPAAYVIFRRPFFWLYSKVWYWLGW